MINILVIFTLLLFIITFDKDKYLYSKYDFLELIANWKNIYKKYTYLNTPLNNFNDKYNAYLLIKGLNLKVPKLYFSGKFKDINLELINSNKVFILKPRYGHSSNNVFLMNKGTNLFDNKKYGINHFKKIFYKNQDIIIEEYIKNFNYDNDKEYSINDDFKVYTFKGTPELILHKFYVDGKYYCNYYDGNCDILNIKFRKDLIVKDKFVKKNHLKKIVNYAKYIGTKIFNQVFVRLDFYLNNNFEVIFGEVTPAPNNGKGFTDEGLNYLNNKLEKNKIYLN